LTEPSTSDDLGQRDPLALATQLVQQAPALEPATIEALHRVLAGDGSALAAAIARVVHYVANGEVSAGIALPEIAEACATLASSDPRVREAACYRIETLTPVPTIDVPVSRVQRR
jgi:hypothetical protein